jgi:hypothetical protein
MPIRGVTDLCNRCSQLVGVEHQLSNDGSTGSWSGFDRTSLAHVVIYRRFEFVCTAMDLGNSQTTDPNIQECHNQLDKEVTK